MWTARYRRSAGPSGVEVRTSIRRLPPGRSLGQLAGLAGEYVGQSVPQMMELAFGPLYAIPDVQCQSLEVLLAFAGAVHQSATRQLYHGLADIRQGLQRTVDDDPAAAVLMYEQSWAAAEDFCWATCNWPLPEGLLQHRSDV